jgi:GNAT superfamily N-acetyltransferase
MPESHAAVTLADLGRPDHAAATLQLLDLYAADPMGDGRPLSADAKRNLIPTLRQHPTTLVFLAFEADQPLGLAICFRGLSTFAAQPLVNISDYFVLPTHRGRGIGRLLLEEIERYARQTGCCKLTLEVQENNHRARGLYSAAGFSQAVYVAEAGGSLFLSKSIKT